MSMLKESFVTDEAEDMSFDPINPGTYTAIMKSAEIKTTANGKGEYIACQWEIQDVVQVEKDNKTNPIGRMVFQNLNTVNDNEMAVKIAKSQLKQICKALNIAELHDTQELIGQPVKLVLKIRPAKGGYDASNDVAKVMSYEDSESNSENSDTPWEE